MTEKRFVFLKSNRKTEMKFAFEMERGEPIDLRRVVGNEVECNPNH